MRLQSFLSQSGVASRRNVIQELEAGKVKVNGEVVRIPSYPIFPGKDEVTYCDQPVKPSQNKLYFIFNKPKGVITTAKDTHGRKTVLDYFKGVKARLYPVGRLDQDTTGLLILTNDGDLAHKLMHPRYGVQKVYEALLDKEISKEQLDQLERGVIIPPPEFGPKGQSASGRYSGGGIIEGKITAPCEIKILGVQDGKAQVEVNLHEGMKRQVRVMFQSVGIRVIDLYRKQYGPLELKGLAPGKYRPLIESEIRTLQSAVRHEPRREPRNQGVNRARKEGGRVENRNEPINASSTREHRRHGVRGRRPFHRG